MSFSRRRVKGPAGLPDRRRQQEVSSPAADRKDPSDWSECVRAGSRGAQPQVQDRSRRGLSRPPPISPRGGSACQHRQMHPPRPALRFLLEDQVRPVRQVRPVHPAAPARPGDPGSRQARYSGSATIHATQPIATAEVAKLRMRSEAIANVRQHFPRCGNGVEGAPDACAVASVSAVLTLSSFAIAATR